jgi:glycosyltransferase involved in cell wall biosynthesis
MKVLIAAASFASTISGLQRHALNLARCLLQLPEITEVHLLLAPWQCNFAQCVGLPSDARLRTHIADIKRNSFSRNLWYYRSLPQLAAHLDADVLHLSYPMPLNRQAFHCSTVVTLHDLYPYEIPANFGFPKFLFNRAVLQQCLRAADAIACVSEATLLRLKQYTPAPVWRKAVRIYNCVEPETAVASESPIPNWKRAPFLLCVAQHRRNKNIPTLIRAFDRLIASDWIAANTKLVVIGTRGPETSAILHATNNTRVRDRIHFLEGLSEPQLQWCYQRCDALIAPSLTEGFDLPVSEGLIAGCRIVCSDIPAHREVAAANCSYFPLCENAVDHLAATVADILDAPKPRPIALPHLSAAALASQYLALYRKLIESAAVRRNEIRDNSLGTAMPDAIAIASPQRQSALEYRGR